ncbi:hypothetical protein FTO70_06620 [Methanosarcina sp. KYL-1]|uniref:threonyl-tRNA synthetase editing domain-containing protein n=1 Tax=Methanosarcina sp. KYL-1 TaxID=2602068 RepID=UPI0021011CA4|nr:hypothetical protein [Methanosarcina sp. KYL-1]
MPEIRIVFVHVDYARYCARKRAKAAEPINIKSDSMEEGVVLYCCVEKNDEDSPASVIENSTGEIIRRLEMIKAKRVMIYPYAHLANDLSSPETAIEILTGLENSLKDRGLEVKRAPFGWYKELETKSKGHPLSDLSITVCPVVCPTTACPTTACPENEQECGMLCPFCHKQIEKKDAVSSIL